MKTGTTPRWEIRTRRLPAPGHNHTLYELYVNGHLVRAQISAFGPWDIAEYVR